MSKTRSSAAQAVFDANVQELSQKKIIFMKLFAYQACTLSRFLMPNKSTWWKNDPQKVT